MSLYSDDMPDYRLNNKVDPKKLQRIILKQDNNVSNMIKYACYSDEEICSFIKHNKDIVVNLEEDTDSLNALHLAAWYGRLKLVKWLVYMKKAKVNVTSRWKRQKLYCTPLGLALEYGHFEIALFLLQAGATFKKVEELILTRFMGNYNGLNNLNDADGKDIPETFEKTHEIFHCSTAKIQPLFYCCIDMQMWHVNRLTPHNMENIIERVYAMCVGENDNFVLGPWQHTKPSKLTAFHDNYPNYEPKKVFLAEFHSVILTTCGKALTCGNNQRGRLGHSNGKSVTEFFEIKINDEEDDTIIEVAIGKDHSLFLTSKNVYVCGDNTNSLLGIANVPFITEPTSLNLKGINKIVCSDYHNIAYNEKKIFCWGKNLGQLGQIQDEYVQTPHLMKFTLMANDEIECIGCCNTATVVATKLGYIYIFRNYNILRLKRNFDMEKSSKICKLQVIGAQPKGVRLRETDTDLLTFCYLTVNGGLYYWSEITEKESPVNLTANYIREFTFGKEGVYCVTFDGRIIIIIKLEYFHYPRFCITIKEFQGFYNAIDVSCDPTGNNFVVLSNEKTLTIPHPTTSQAEAHMLQELTQLKEETHEFDNIHDVKILHKDEIIYAHKYILSKASKKLFEIFNEAKGQYEIKVPDDLPMDDIIKAAYYKRNSNSNEESVIKQLQDVQISDEDEQEKSLDYLDFEELIDVKLKSNDGVVYPAHKSILIARSEYFKALLTGSWAVEKDKDGFITLNIDYTSVIVKTLMTYIYKNKLECAPLHLLTMMYCSDHYGLLHLFELCQIELSKSINLQVLEMLFVHPDWILRNEAFKTSCFYYICSNLRQMLVRPAFSQLPSKFFTELTKFYRVITNCPAQAFERKEPSNYPVWKVFALENPINFDEEIEAEAKIYNKELLEKVLLLQESVDKKLKSRNKHRNRNSSESQKKDEIVSPFFSPIPPGAPESQTPREIECKKIIDACYKQAFAHSPIARTPYFDALFQCDKKDFPTLLGHNVSPKNQSPLPNSKTSPKMIKMPKVSQRTRKLSEKIEEQQSPKQTPESPWKIVEEPCTSGLVLNDKKSLKEIIEKEKQQKVCANRVLNKPLKYVVLEDKAIEALEKFYNISNVEDEIITVTRAPVYVEVDPVWVANKKTYAQPNFSL